MSNITRIDLPTALYGTPVVEWEYGTGEDRFGHTLSKINFPTRYYRVVHVKHPKWHAVNILNIGHGQKVHVFAGSMDEEDFIQVGPYRAYYEGSNFITLEYEGKDANAERNIPFVVNFLKNTDGELFRTVLILLHQVIFNDLWHETFPVRQDNWSKEGTWSNRDAA